MFDWDSALYTLVSIFVTGKVVDAIYTDHAKLTLMIITDKGEEMRRSFTEEFVSRPNCHGWCGWILK